MIIIIILLKRMAFPSANKEFDDNCLTFAVLVMLPVSRFLDYKRFKKSNISACSSSLTDYFTLSM